MVRLTQLTEEEEKYYCSLIAETDMNRQRNILRDKIESIKKKLDQTDKLCDIVLKKIQEEDLSSISSDIKSITSNLELSALNAIALPICLGNRREERDIMGEKPDEQLVTLHIDNDVLYISILSLLPHVRATSKNLFREMCGEAFRNFFQNGKYKVYEEKVVIVITQCYENECFERDHDNSDYSTIINLINMYTLHDDNPTWCDLYISSKIGECNRTDIQVVPISRFMSRK